MLAFMAFVLLSFIMGFAKPAPEQPKRYIVITARGMSPDKFQEEVEQKLSEGWHLEGGAAGGGSAAFMQAMSK